MHLLWMMWLFYRVRSSPKINTYLHYNNNNARLFSSSCWISLAVNKYPRIRFFMRHFVSFKSVVVIMEVSFSNGKNVLDQVVMLTSKLFCISKKIYFWSLFLETGIKFYFILLLILCITTYGLNNESEKYIYIQLTPNNVDAV